MSDPNIVVSPDEVHAELNKVRSDVNDLPSPTMLKQVDGARSSIGGTFTRGIVTVAAVATRATLAVKQELLDNDSAVRTALDELISYDGEIAASADQVDPTPRHNPNLPSTSLGSYGPTAH